GDGSDPRLEPAHLRHAQAPRPVAGQRRRLCRTAARMNVAAAQRAPSRGLDDAVVEAAEVVAGHDGAAELLGRLRHGNGVSSAVMLDPETGFDLLRAAETTGLDGLVGQSWREITRGLWEH